MKPLQALCADAIAKKAAPGELAHITVRDEDDGVDGRVRVAEAFTSRNHSPNCPDRHKHNRFVVRVPYAPGERAVNMGGDVRSNEGLATEEAFARLLAAIQAPPVLKQEPTPEPVAVPPPVVAVDTSADTEPPPEDPKPAEVKEQPVDTAVAIGDEPVTSEPQELKDFPPNNVPEQ